MRQVPILVTGAPRSSTTFLGNMLALPGHVQYIDEPFNAQTGIEGVRSSFPNPMRIGGLDDLDAEYESIVEQLLAGKARFKSSELRPATDNPVRKLARNTLVSREYITYQLHSKNPHKQRYLIKDPMAFSLSEYLHRRFGMQTVVIMRHPLSTVASYKRLDWHYDIETELLPWAMQMSPELKKVVDRLNFKALSVVERWSVFWLAVYAVLDEFLRRNPGMLFITHEDLSLHPHEALEWLYWNLGLHYTERIRRIVTEHTDKTNPAMATDNQVHELHRNSAEVVRGWKNMLTSEEVETIHKICGAFASRFYPAESWQ